MVQRPMAPTTCEYSQMQLDGVPQWGEMRISHWLLYIAVWARADLYQTPNVEVIGYHFVALRI